MAVPKKRTAKSKRNRRRSHHARHRLQLVACPRCKALLLPHTACGNCGTYKGREVIDMVSRLSKQERRVKEKARAGTQ